jgi:hypothetical protein
MARHPARTTRRRSPPPLRTPHAQTEAQLAARFTGKGRWKSRLPDILAALEALGRARRLDDGRWLG